MSKKKIAIGFSLVAAGVLLVGGFALADATSPFDAVQQVYNDIMTNSLNPPSATALVQGAIQGMLNVVNDPYSQYMSPAGYQSFMQTLNGNYAGIGVKFYVLGGYATVEQVFSGSPAAGSLQAGDQINSVNGQSVVNLPIDQISGLLKGTAGTQVTIGVLRPGAGGSQQMTFALTRAAVTVPAASLQMLPGNIAEISINDFNASTTSQTEAALQAAAAQHPVGYILDLRGNPGGLVDSAEAIAQDLIPSGVILTVVQPGVAPSVVTSNSGKTLGAPLVVLVDGGTASAAEILTASLQDNSAGYVMGVTTYGKGVMQNLTPLPDGGTLKLTVAKWLTPGGAWIQGKGIAPSFIVSGQQAAQAAAQEYLLKTPQLSVNLQVGSTASTTNNERTSLPVAPLVQNGVIYVPLRAVVSLLGATVNWDSASSTVVVDRGTHALTLPVGGTQGILDGTAANLPGAVLNLHGTTFLPVTALTDLGATVKAQNGQIYITI